MKVAVVCNYPPPGECHAPGVGGAIASYSCNLVSSLPKDDDFQYEVYANLIEDKPVNHYTEDGIVVYRCWEKGILALFSVVKRISKNRPDLVHIQYDFFLYGGKRAAVLFPFFLIAVRMMGIPTVVTLHGIVSLKRLDRITIKKSGTWLPLFVVRAAFFILTRLILLLANKVIVHGSNFLDILKTEYHVGIDNIVSILHGVEERPDKAEPMEAKRVMGFADQKVILFFGYLAGYKGLELLIDAFGLISEKYPDCILRIVGEDTPGFFVGNPNQGRCYSEMLRDMAAKTSSQISFLGFIPEDQIGLCFCAADVVIFPYLLRTGGSGALSLCVAYERPFLVSDVFEDIIDCRELIFRRSPEDLARKVEQFFAGPVLHEMAMDCVQRMKSESLWPEVGKATRAVYQQTKPSRHGIGISRVDEGRRTR